MQRYMIHVFTDLSYWNLKLPSNKSDVLNLSDIHADLELIKGKASCLVYILEGT